MSLGEKAIDVSDLQLVEDPVLPLLRQLRHLLVCRLQHWLDHVELPRSFLRRWILLGFVQRELLLLREPSRELDVSIFQGLDRAATGLKAPDAALEIHAVSCDNSASLGRMSIARQRVM